MSNFNDQKNPAFEIEQIFDTNQNMRMQLCGLKKNFNFKMEVCKSRCRNLLQAIDYKDKEIVRLQKLLWYLEIQLE